MAKLSKKFIELASNDESVHREVVAAQVKALMEVIEAHGLKAEAEAAATAEVEKVAEAHGFKAGAMEELSDDELRGVAGGAYDPFDDAESQIRMVCGNVGICIFGK